ncbi:hypothetical protein L484_003314 [Morus notabilis]|uniref:TCP domain-containing protein n=1 Tax=Morus notabilis TaxID=981085 RepID=W9RL10_9ROSA|nr:hypothetical protein L484_003314 [Morus notabilis]
MRLSIDVAREFFDLQELLGFERASKTVEWLLRKARSEIKKLKDSNNEGGCSSTCPEMQTPSPNSESCEGASGLDEVGINGEDQGVAGTSSSKPLINQPASNKSEEKQQTGDQLPNQNMMDIDMNNNIVIPNSSLGAVMQVSRYDQRYEFSQEILPISNPNGWNIFQVSNHDHIRQTSTTSTGTTAPIVDYETYSYLVNHLEKWNNSLVANSVSNVGTTSGATGFRVPQQGDYRVF